jgi:uncharacterized oxidoreductase
MIAGSIGRQLNPGLVSMNATGITALITGGATGIGFALARTLMDSGNTVIICGRSADALQRATAALPGLIALRCDLTDPADRASLCEALTARFPKLDLLVNNAGTLHVADLTQPAHVQELETEIATNLLAPVALTSLLLPLLQRQSAATIVNVTSGYVFLPSARTAPYCASKVALRTMTRSLRFQLRGTPIKVVEVMPPAVDTALASHYSGAKLTPDEVARAIMHGLLRDRIEIVIGVSKLARLLGRLAPRTAFLLMNLMEEKNARRGL